MPRLDAERVALWRSFQTAGEVVSRIIEAEMADEFHLSLPQFDLLAVGQHDRLQVQPEDPPAMNGLPLPQAHPRHCA